MKINIVKWAHKNWVDVWPVSDPAPTALEVIEGGLTTGREWDDEDNLEIVGPFDVPCPNTTYEPLSDKRFAGYTRAPGGFRRWEIELMIAADTIPLIVPCGITSDGTHVYAVYQQPVPK